MKAQIKEEMFHYSQLFYWRLKVPKTVTFFATVEHSTAFLRQRKNLRYIVNFKNSETNNFNEKITSS